ncbi:MULTISPECIES: F0F1 ATP synthase subunit alpha [Bacillus cereus group]|uniref:ATP synthase subunit A n=2 Tax=Bacillus cytotoxicus TaxID=580165 RepID=A0AAX2CHE5_9BACI|nr:MULTISPECIES: F0F1 ATP synthase subunit alpha [Bacillus cereus group]ABS22352.1 ATP synthase subunit A [Bacillus cytotoxicus NVH 391-98]AWC28960.1 ATP synthase F0F1 subunit alpha [Bacillus cytotoxicus]AWC39655.1 ATP synthase F0F1 subunit alpha [Bacillus cytotoxicus]AWC45018.1 ATP synthase F0F1 subunit alpha [Bacillus cytotoxicus]AWC47586.1 ATP synthase F0F1 subunit alpha [Bacillus cytotoxicus]
MNIKKVILASALGLTTLAGVNVSSLEIPKASAASVELDTIQGQIVDVVDGTIYIQSKEYNDHMDYMIQIILDNPTHTFKVGDTVKATGTLWRNMATYMRANAVEKVNKDDSFTPGIHYDQQGTPAYIIGTITKHYNFLYDINKSQDFVVVTYPNKEGKPLTVHVSLTSNNKFNVGDTVKVKNIMEWFRSDQFETDEVNMEKINETKTSNVQDDRWIWS